jgi:hypothetical protein
MTSIKAKVVLSILLLLTVSLSFDLTAHAVGETSLYVARYPYKETYMLGGDNVYYTDPPFTIPSCSKLHVDCNLSYPKDENFYSPSRAAVRLWLYNEDRNQWVRYQRIPMPQEGLKTVQLYWEDLPAGTYSLACEDEVDDQPRSDWGLVYKMDISIYYYQFIIKNPKNGTQ